MHSSKRYLIKNYKKAPKTFLICSRQMCREQIFFCAPPRKIFNTFCKMLIIFAKRVFF